MFHDGYYWIGTTEEDKELAATRYAKCLCGHEWVMHRGDHTCTLCRKCKKYAPRPSTAAEVEKQKQAFEQHGIKVCRGKTT